MTPKTFYLYFRRLVQSSPFRLYMHILTEQYLSAMASAPRWVKDMSEITLDQEKERTNRYAVNRLRGMGYRNIYYARRLHAKLLVGINYEYAVVCTANMSARSMRNYEVCVLVENPPRKERVRLRRIIGAINAARTSALQR